jgi:flagellar FliJ protein
MNIEPLLVLLGQHERRRDEALAEHLRLQRAAEAAAAQSTQLLDYRRSYEQRWTSQFQQTSQIELIRCYQAFSERLTQAVDQQGSSAEFASQQMENAAAALREAEMRCASVRKLIERRQHEQRASEERRDQKQTDEQAARAGWDRRQNADSRSM